MSKIVGKFVQKAIKDSKKNPVLPFTIVKEWRSIIELKVGKWTLDYNEKKEELKVEKSNFYSIISTKDKELLFDMLFVLGINLQVEEEFYL